MPQNILFKEISKEKKGRNNITGEILRKYSTCSPLSKNFITR
jgi:hypothetical protein